jgi:hypothetical protein
LMNTWTVASRSGNVYAMDGMEAIASGVTGRLNGLLILPDVMGHKPMRLALQGSTWVLMMGYPYAKMEMSKMTWPSIDDMAIMLMDAVRLFGVKVTSNKLAVKPEFSWHDASEVDRSTYSALVGRTIVAREARRSGFSDGRRIVAGLPAGCPGCTGGRSQVGFRLRRGQVSIEDDGVTGFDELTRPAC